METKCTTYETLTDTELVMWVLSGDRAAVAFMLLERCGAGIQYLVRGRCRYTGLEFSEAVSEAYLLLSRNDWAALRGYRGTSENGRSCRLSTYILCILTRHFWRKYGGAMQEKERHVSLDDMEPFLCSAEKGSESALSYDELMAVILSLENETDRKVLILYKMQDRPVQEVADKLGIGVNTVYTRCSRAMDKLRVKLREVMDYA